VCGLAWYRWTVTAGSQLASRSAELKLAQAVTSTQTGTAVFKATRAAAYASRGSDPIGCDENFRVEWLAQQSLCRQDAPTTMALHAQLDALKQSLEGKIVSQEIPVEVISCSE
jgi:hypothetical protein